MHVNYGLTKDINGNGNDAEVPKLSSIGFVGSIFHINVCVVIMFLLLNIYLVHKNCFILFLICHCDFICDFHYLTSENM